MNNSVRNENFKNKIRFSTSLYKELSQKPQDLIKVHVFQNQNYLMKLLNFYYLNMTKSSIYLLLFLFLK